MLDIQENLSLLAQAHLERDTNLVREAKRRLSMSVQIRLCHIYNMPRKERVELSLALIIVDLNEQMDRFYDTSKTTFRHN